ncbi:MAG TPA: serine--tRNA ligase, partial [Candidatus Acetothermia bacterium]|nr:serine--tRNA ligase [Candidatus Acetothermia bacterium]
MIDLQRIREDPEGVLRRLRKRDPNVSLDGILALDERRRSLIREVEELRRRRNTGSQEVARLQREGRVEEAGALIAELKMVSQRLKELEAELSQVERELEAELLSLPNIPHDSVPTGTKEEKVILRTYGVKPEFDFQPRNHVELGKSLGILDFERAAVITGSRFPLYIGDGALLELSLIKWMFELHVREHGYIPVLPPILANRRSFEVSGQLPKFADDLYHCERDDLFLNPTAESLLANL